MMNIRTLVLFFSIGCLLNGFAQLSGTASVPGTYSSVASAIAALNSSGINAAFTLNIAAGYTETSVPGGYTLIAGGSATAPITIRKNGTGANPVIFAYSGNKTPGASNQDGVFRIIGSDYLTIDGLDIIDGNTSNPATMEFGIGFFKKDSSDGCQHNIVRNCSIELNRVNNGSGNAPAGDGSRGIEIVNALTAAHTASLSVAGRAAGNSFNRIENCIVRQCNIGIALAGLDQPAWSAACDTANEIVGNQILNFGGGGQSSASSGLRSSAQFGLLISGNKLNSNDGSGSPHVITLRGIHLLDGSGASSSVVQNTICVHGGGNSSQLGAIVNESGGGGAANLVTIKQNLISGCSYNTATSGAFYGIWNSAGSHSLLIAENAFEHNSTAAASGNTYLIYNNGSVLMSSVIQNTLSYKYTGTQSYSGNTYGIYNSGAAAGATANIAGNVVRDFFFVNQPGSGNLFLIHNTAACNKLSIDSNRVHDLTFLFDGPIYVINNTSPTASLLAVRDNSITGLQRTGQAGHLYGYYGSANAAGTAKHIISGNLLSGITATITGSGNFYGLYNAEGNNSPYPQKTISSNTVENVHMNGSGTFYGIYATDLGDGGDTLSSQVRDNNIRYCSFNDATYGLYCAGPVSPSLRTVVSQNRILGVTSANGNIYGAYLGSNNSGMDFSGNIIGGIVTTGSASTAYGFYGANTTTSNIFNNFIGHVESASATGANRSNGIYISAGQDVNLVYNTVLLQGGTGAGSNALYSSSTATISLHNNIFVNKSAVSGSGVAAAYRRSTSGLGSYSQLSDRNVFYTSSPTSSTPVFYNGSAHSSLSAFQSFVSPRESNSLYHDPVFISTVVTSPNYLHINSFPASPVESGGAILALTHHDADGQVRFGHSSYSGAGTAPDIGADEFDQSSVPCSSVSIPAVSATSIGICAGQTISIVSPGVGAGSDVLYEWQVSGSAAGTYSSTGVTGLEYHSTPMSAGNYYFRVVNTCTNTTQTVASAIVTVVVTAPPSPGIVAATQTVCAGDTLVLSATGGTDHTFHWLGPYGYSSWKQSPVIRNIDTHAAGQYSVIASVNSCTGTAQAVTISVSQVSVSLTAGKQFLCAGDTTLLQVSGNIVTYTWNTGVTNSSLVVTAATSTVFSVVAKNSDGCSASRSVALSVLDPTISAVNATVCGSASIATLAVQAFTPSLVSWYTNSVTLSPAGTGASLTVPANVSATLFAQAKGACNSSLIPVHLLVTPLPVLLATVVPSQVCPFSQATISLSGATSFTWQGLSGSSSVVVTPSISSTYSVKGSVIAGCSGSIQISVPVFSVPALTVSPSSASVCPSSKITVEAEGAATFTWSTGAVGKTATLSPAVAQNYSVFGTTPDGCLSSQTVAVHTRSLPVVAVFSSADSICPGADVSLSASGAVSYTWLPGNVTGDTNTVTPTVSSVYNVIGTAVNSCTQVAFAFIKVLPCASVGDQQKTRILVFPNPFYEGFTIRNELCQRCIVHLYNGLGLLIDRQVMTTREQQFDMRHNPPGIYVLEICDGHQTKRMTIIRQ